MGKLTMNIGLGRYDGNEYKLIIDIRYPHDLNGEVIKVITEGATIKLSYDEYGCDKQEVASNSLEISKLIKQNTEKLLKRIRINISDCPKWMQNELTHMNEKELKKREDKNKIRKIFKR